MTRPARIVRALINATAVAALATGSPVHAQQGTTSPAAERYLAAALDTIEAVTLGADTIPWTLVRDSARLRAEGARTERDNG